MDSATYRLCPPTHAPKLNRNKQGDETSFGGLKQRVDKLQGKKLLLTRSASNADKAQLTRSVAYDMSKTQVTKWEATVKANREAPSMSFPLHNAVAEKSANSRSNTDLVEKMVPTTDFEKQIAGQ